MIILSIDTCGLLYSIAIIKNNEVISHVKASDKNMQCEELVLKIELLMRKSSVTYKNIDVIVVTSGPGTFNGVRIGISATYGISLARGIKIATISTLEVVAYRNKTTAVCFTPDSQIGFFQKFDSKFQPLSEVMEVKLDAVDENSLLVFDINSYDSSEVSNAISAGLLYITRGRAESSIFYGKPPSIHAKTDLTTILS